MKINVMLRKRMSLDEIAARHLRERAPVTVGVEFVCAPLRRDQVRSSALARV